MAGGFLMPEKTLLTSTEIERALARIAHEIVERNKGAEGLVFVGMRTRGVPLARRVAEMIRGFEGIPIPVGALDISLHRDDISPSDLKSANTSLTDIPIDISDRRVILVDDVLYTGRTIRAALDAIMDFGRPKQVQLAVLIDRGHREIPLSADYIGETIKTQFNQEIRVRMIEVKEDGIDEVTLVTLNVKGDS